MQNGFRDAGRVWEEGFSEFAGLAAGRVKDNEPPSFATLAGTYNNLTGKNTAWPDSEAVINANFPVGQQYNLDTDNPFPV